MLWSIFPYINLLNASGVGALFHFFSAWIFLCEACILETFPLHCSLEIRQIFLDPSNDNLPVIH